MLARQAFLSGRPLRLGPIRLLIDASARQLLTKDELTSLTSKVPHLSVRTTPNLVIEAGKQGSEYKVLFFEPSPYGFEAAKCYIMPLLGNRSRLSTAEAIDLFDKVCGSPSPLLQRASYHRQSLLRRRSSLVCRFRSWAFPKSTASNKSTKNERDIVSGLALTFYISPR